MIASELDLPSRDGSYDETTLVPNVMHFCRLLREAGLRIGPGHTLDAVRAVLSVGPERREDVRWALHSVLVSAPDEREIFRQAFELFWRDPFGQREALASLLPTVEALKSPRPDPVSRRLAEAVGRRRDRSTPRRDAAGEAAAIVMTWSDRETIRNRDFEDMSAAEMREAKAIIAQMRIGLRPRTTRRFRTDPSGRRVDMNATLRAGLRGDRELIPLRWRTPVRRTPPIVVLCDVSGSMERYARILLHFVHALTNERDRISTFLFGTRLSNVTRALKHRDVDRALADVGRLSQDWSGGTRIGECLKRFNRDWSRRVLGQGAIVLLITDGLDRDGGLDISREAARLNRSCRRVVWLNPLLRFEQFEPRAAGVRALLPHVDEFRPIHNLNSLTQLAEALASSSG